MHKIMAAVLAVGCTLALCAQAPRYTRAATPTGSLATDRDTGNIPRTTRSKRVPKRSYYQTGGASYYGDKFHGRKTASGERYDRNKMTAAHRTLPFGTIVRVTDLKTGKSVTVRINDRGPHKRSRIIDLSRAAAKKIGMLADGVIDVGIEIVEK